MPLQERSNTITGIRVGIDTTAKKAAPALSAMRGYGAQRAIAQASRIAAPKVSTTPVANVWAPLFTTKSGPSDAPNRIEAPGDEGIRTEIVSGPPIKANIASAPFMLVAGYGDMCRANRRQSVAHMPMIPRSTSLSGLNAEDSS